jgi:8-oxo-dGTP diphosphatase
MIHKVGLIAVENGALLLVRKRGSQWWILPGGKIDPGESFEECLAREIDEELGCACEASYWYTVEDVAADGGPLRMELYRGHFVGEPKASAEIEELWWWRPGQDREKLSPSLRRQIVDRVFPATTAS